MTRVLGRLIRIVWMPMSLALLVAGTAAAQNGDESTAVNAETDVPSVDQVTQADQAPQPAAAQPTYNDFVRLQTEQAEQAAADRQWYLDGMTGLEAQIWQLHQENQDLKDSMSARAASH